MNNIKSVSKNECTGCGICSAKCPKKCISMENDDTDNIYPKVDERQCIDCALCLSVCHANDNSVKLNEIQKAYAAWNTDQEMRKKGASGGVITGIYQFAEDRDYKYVGVQFDSLWNLEYKISSEKKDYLKYMNSKYVYADIRNILAEIEKKLKDGIKMIVIGIPCQIAALKKFLRKDYSNLITVDLICHGVCSNEYLKQHIDFIEKNTNKSTTKLYFRNPALDTDKFHFTLQQQEEIFYDKTTLDDDYYQIGYHKAIIYRENCYSCKYAKKERIADITVGDYWKLGEEIPFDYDTKNVSLIFSNTKKGEELIKKARDEGYIFCVERPISESLKVQGQLNKPSMASKQHYIFMKQYRKYRNFEKACEKAMKIDIVCNKLGLQNELRILRRIKNKFFKKEKNIEDKGKN